jgi:hypothetical protein
VGNGLADPLAVGALTVTDAVPAARMKARLEGLHPHVESVTQLVSKLKRSSASRELTNHVGRHRLGGGGGSRYQGLHRLTGNQLVAVIVDRPPPSQHRRLQLASAVVSPPSTTYQTSEPVLPHSEHCSGLSSGRALSGGCTPIERDRTPFPHPDTTRQ